MNVFPKQKISTAEKYKIEKGERVSNFVKQNTDYYVYNSLLYNDDYEEMVSLYNAANGIIDYNAYSYVLNPYNTENTDFTKFPAAIRNYSIIKPIVKLFVGENDKRPNNMEVVVLNSDTINKYKESLSNKIHETLKQQFVNKLNELGVNTGVDTKKVPSLEEVAAEHKANYNDERAINGQEAVDYIEANCDLDDKYQDAFYDWIVTGRVYSYREIYRNDVYVDIISPLEMWSTRDSHSNFVEDDSAAVRKFRLPPNAVIDRFRSKLSDEDITFLDNLRNGGNTTQIITPTINLVNSGNLDGIRNDNPKNTLLNNGLVDVFHVTWKTFKPIGILTYKDEVGQIQEKEVDDSYKMDKEIGDISLEIEWISEYWESWRIGTNIYLGGNPLLVQRDELNNTSICKGCYNGRTNDDRLGEINSIVKQGLPYDVLHNIYHYRLERTLAKNKDKIMLFPMGLKPEKWDTDKFMYEVDATGVAWFDETKPNAASVLASIRAIDLSLASYAKDMIDFIRYIKNEYWESIGVTPQRYGDVQASEGKGNVEQSIFRSAIITSEEFRKFDKFREKDSNGVLDYSKVAWINGKKGMYVNSDNRKVMLEIDGEVHKETEYAVFCKNNSMVAEKLATMKGLAHAQVQKTGKLSLSSEIVDANNFAKVKDLIKRGEEIEQNLIQAAAAKQQESDERIGQMNKEAADVKAQSDKYKVDKEYQKAIDVALIQADISVLGLNSDSGSDDADHKQQDLNIKHLQATSAHRLGEKQLEHDKLKIASDNYNEQENRKMQQKEIDSREKVANKKASK